jgi:hypothetical protein
VGSQAADDNATDREAFTEEILRIAGRRRAGPPTLSRLADAVAGDGGGVTKLVFLPDAWDERYALRLKGYDDAVQAEAAADAVGDNKPQGRRPRKASPRDEAKGDALEPDAYRERSEQVKRDAGPPFSWTAVDVRTVYPVYQGGRIGEVLEVTKRAASATFRRWRLAYDAELNIVPEELAEPVPTDAAQRAGAGDLTDTPWAGEVEVLEHWDDTYATIFVCGKNKAQAGTGQVVDQWKHGYGRHPYFWTLGFQPGFWTNRKVGWSISETKRWLVEFRSYLWTVFAQQMARDTLPPVSAEIPDTAAPIRGDDGTPKAAEAYELGKLYYLQPGEKRVPWQFPNTTQSLKEMIGLTTEMIDRLGTPRMEQNIGGIEASGFAINQVLAEARLRFDPLAGAIEETLEDLTRFAWHLIRTKIGEKVWVYATGKDGGWKSMGPDDLRGDVRIEWKLDPTLPSAALVESRYWVEQVKAGFASMDQAIEAQGRNPNEVRYGQTLDRMRASEWYQKFEDQFVVAQVGRGDLLAEAWEAQQLAATGQLPGAPGGPNPPGAVVPQGGIDPNAVAATGQAPAGMNTPGIPDGAGLQIAPNQEGANGVQLPGGGTPGAPSIPTRSAAAGTIQPLRG